jgi:hypothetical protein
MKRWILLLAVYVLVHSIDGDSVREYQGQSIDTIKSLLIGEGKTGEEITQTQFQAFIDNAQANAKPLPVVVDPVKAQAITDMNSKTNTDAQRIDAIVNYLGLKQ